MPLHAQAWQAALSAIRLRVSSHLIYQWEGEPGLVTAHRLLSRRSPKVSRRAVVAVLREKERCFRRLARHIRVSPALVRLLETLSRRGLRLGLVTGTSSHEVRAVVPAHVLARFDVIVTGDRVHHGKPHPEPYRLAFQRLRVRPSQAIVIENAPYGIRSARRARTGFIVALASSLPSRLLQEADLVISSIPRLCSAVNRLTTVS